MTERTCQHTRLLLRAEKEHAPSSAVVAASGPILHATSKWAPPAPGYRNYPQRATQPACDWYELIGRVPHGRQAATSLRLIGATNSGSVPPFGPLLLY
jgi:hypothetical protein